jgi:hypothetical protein
MSAAQLLERFKAMASSGAVIDWREMREEILDEHELAPNVADRVLCLKLHFALMDMVERNGIEPENLEKFKKTRSQDYALMLVKEAMIGQTDDNVDPMKMLPITTREVRDGRMSPDDELHTLAVAGAEILGSPKPPGGLGVKLRSWFKRDST